MTFAETCLERIDKTLANIWSSFQTVDKYKCVFEIREFVIFGPGKLDHFAVAIKT